LATLVCVGHCAISESEKAALMKFYEATGNDWKTDDNNWLSNAHDPCDGTNGWAGVTCDGSDSVTDLKINGNILSGTLPLGMTDLPNLDTLDLANNMIGGELPGDWSFASLTKLLLDSNEFTGPIPSSWTLPVCTEIDLNTNSLEGPLPDFDSVSALEKIDLSRNQIGGAIPDWSLSSLQTMNLELNRLVGPLPLWAGLTSIKDIAVSNNRIIGQIPDWTLSGPLVENIDLSKNRLYGSVPAWSNILNAEADLRFNSLCGVAPNGEPLWNGNFGDDKSLTGNLLECPLPTWCNSEFCQCDSEAGKCENGCFRGCSTCNGVTRTECTACEAGFFFDPTRSSVDSQGGCPTYCPAGYYPNDSNNECTLCEGQCATCFGPGEDNCATCKTGFKREGTSCKFVCTSGYEEGNVCRPCMHECDTCSNGTECLSCASPRFLYQSRCVINCPPGFEEDNRSCVNTSS